MERTRIHEALKGVRGQRGVALAQLETLLVRFSQLIVDFLEIAEIDINPLLATPERVLALDARVLLGPPLTPGNAERPRLAIHPYPNQFISRYRLEDGTDLTIRPIRPEDEPLVIELHATLSEHSIRMRFFSMVKRLTHESLIRLCYLDYEREMALAAVFHDEKGHHILGVSRYYLEPETRSAEFAVVVSDRWQGHGLGRHLMERLIDVAKQSGVKRLMGSVLSDNQPMLQLTQELGFVVKPTEENGVVEVMLELDDQGAA
jgi:acetyltransferase